METNRIFPFWLAIILALSVSISTSTLVLCAETSKAPGSTSDTTSGDELPIPGNPPLTQAIVDQETQFFEWLLDAPFTVEQRDQFRASLVRTWKGHHQDEIDSTMNVLKFQEQLNTKPRQQRELVREQLCEKYVGGLRQNPDSLLSKWVLNIYDSAHRPIAKGNPPLTTQVADAYAEVVAFMIKESLGKQALHANRHFKDSLAKSLAAQYSSYSPEQQRSFSQMPYLWKALRYSWAQSSEKEKKQFRRRLGPIVQNLLASASTQDAASKQDESSDACGSRELSCNSGYSEHRFVENMCNSSFASTISMHMSVFR
jgi:hypothetical protein